MRSPRNFIFFDNPGINSQGATAASIKKRAKNRNESERLEEEIQFPTPVVSHQRKKNLTSESLGSRIAVYIDELYRYAFVLARNAQDAEDLVRETYVRALQAADSLRQDSNVKAWLFTILRNIWLNQLRQRNARPKLVELDADERSTDLAVAQSRDPLAQYESKQQHEQVRKGILQLPVEFREILILREYDELSYEELASLLACPVGTVMSRLARARDYWEGQR